jgi:hypothetical protein
MCPYFLNNRGPSSQGAGTQNEKKMQRMQDHVSLVQKKNFGDLSVPILLEMRLSVLVFSQISIELLSILPHHHCQEHEG